MDPNNQDIPGMTPDPKYSEKTPILSQDSNKVQKEMEKTKKELEKLKSFIVKKYNFIQAIGMSYPLHDTGILAGLRVAEIHKSLVFQIFVKLMTYVFQQLLTLLKYI